MGGKVGENPAAANTAPPPEKYGGAARRRIFASLEKPEGRSNAPQQDAG